MDVSHMTLYRMLCLPDVPSTMLPANPRFVMPLLESTVLQGTPLRKRMESECLVSPKARFRLPRLRPQLILPEESTVEKEQDMSLMIRTLGCAPPDPPLSLSPDLDAGERVLRLRKIRGSCPRNTEPTELTFSVTPLMRRSAEMVPSQSKEHLKKNSEISALPRAARSRFLPDPFLSRHTEHLNSSEVLLARKAPLKSHRRYRTQFQPSLTTDPLSKPPLKPRKGLKLLELKPTPEQLCTVYASLSAEMSEVVVESNGTIPRQGEGSYKCYIGPGNNSQLVVHLVKKRWFWTKVDDWEQADFIWTQNKQQSIVATLSRASSDTPRLRSTKQSQIPVLNRATRLLLESERKKTGISLISDSSSYTSIEPCPQSVPLRVYNRLERNYQLTSKKRLYHNMKAFCDSRGTNVFDYIPLTFHVENGRKDEEFYRFMEEFQRIAVEEKGNSYNLWIVKPGEGTNCGHGIHIASELNEIKELVGGKYSNSGRKRTYIIQKYIERPLLVHKRKFDIRCYGLLTSFHGHLQGYFYHDGYLRTSSKEFSLRNSNRFVHLTNDAVQKKSEDYGKFEHGNKLSYPDFQKYLDVTYPGEVDFMRDIWPQIKLLVTTSFEATHTGVDPYKRRHTFEILGYDFMVDEDFKVWLIEVNTNPCLALSSAYLARLIPAMLENAFRIVLDSHFPEPESRRRQPEWSSQSFTNRFELVFSSLHYSQSTPVSPQAPVSSGESSDDSPSDTGN